MNNPTQSRFHYMASSSAIFRWIKNSGRTHYAHLSPREKKTHTKCWMLFEFIERLWKGQRTNQNSRKSINNRYSRQYSRKPECGPQLDGLWISLELFMYEFSVSTSCLALDFVRVQCLIFNIGFRKMDFIISSNLKFICEWNCLGWICTFGRDLTLLSLSPFFFSEEWHFKNTQLRQLFFPCRIFASQTTTRKAMHSHTRTFASLQALFRHPRWMSGSACKPPARSAIQF